MKKSGVSLDIGNSNTTQYTVQSDYKFGLCQPVSCQLMQGLEGYSSYAGKYLGLQVMYTLAHLAQWDKNRSEVADEK